MSYRLMVTYECPSVTVVLDVAHDSRANGSDVDQQISPFLNLAAVLHLRLSVSLSFKSSAPSGANLARFANFRE